MHRLKRKRRQVSEECKGDELLRHRLLVNTKSSKQPPPSFDIDYRGFPRRSRDEIILLWKGTVNNLRKEANTYSSCFLFLSPEPRIYGR